MATPKNAPQRTCLGCRAAGPKSELVRLVASPDGITVDPTGAAAGRGAYLHLDDACLASALRRRALPRALRTTAEPVADLAQRVAACANRGDTR